jgi:hypothetical protein
LEVFVLRLRLERTWCGPKCTIGTLYVNGKAECFTLEDVRREVKGRPVEEWKVPGETAIPAGVYNIVITPSNRFKRDLPLLENVPGFQGIRIHPWEPRPRTPKAACWSGSPRGRIASPSRAVHSSSYSRRSKNPWAAGKK